MVNDLTRDSLDAAHELISTFPFKPFRNYRAISRRRQSDVLKAELDAALGSGDAFGLINEGGEQAAAIVVKRLPWDSSLFGMPMAKVLYVLHGPNTGRPAIREVVCAALARASEWGLRHLAVRVDVADLETVQVLEETGFRMMDALATHLYHPRWPPPKPVKEVGLIRPFRPDDTPQILDITREAYEGFRGRYHLDPHLRPDRADTIYIDWASKCCSGEWADVVLVAENGQGELHGWLCYRRLEPVSRVSGTEIRGGGLGACRPDRPGAYTGLMSAAIQRIYADGAVTEAQTQIFNFPTVRVYEAVGMAFVRGDYTMHRSID